MKLSFFFAIAIFILLFTTINYYIGRRGWQAFGAAFGGRRRYGYWAAFWFLALSYPLARLTRDLLPISVNQVLNYIGSYWLGAIYYLILLLILVDCFRFMERRHKFLPARLKQPGMASIVGGLILGTVLCLLVYGTWNARQPVVNHYDLTIPKPAGNMKSLHVVVVSDIHLGTIMDNGRLVELVKLINARQPDIVLLPGDIIDEDIVPFKEQQMAVTFRQLQPPLGVYAVLGNHELYSSDLPGVTEALQSAGITVLRNHLIKVAKSFYLVGRDDSGHQRSGLKPRPALASILAGTNRQLPVILMDHQPRNFSEAQRAGIDLQLSGHTHRGQFWPNQLITDRIFEQDWGYLQKKSLQVLVSDGFGTWGPPLRIGNQPEIIDLTIHFTSSPAAKSAGTAEHIK